MALAVHLFTPSELRLVERAILFPCWEVPSGAMTHLPPGFSKSPRTWAGPAETPKRTYLDHLGFGWWEDAVLPVVEREEKPFAPLPI